MVHHPRRIHLQRILLLALTGGALSYGYLLSLPDLYQSDAMLLSHSRNGSARLGGGLLSLAGIPGEEQASYPALLTNRWMMENLLLESFSFHYRPWRWARERSFSGPLRDFLDPGHKRPVDQNTKRLARWIGVREQSEAGILQVSVTAPSPELACQVNERLLANLRQAIKAKTDELARAKAEQARIRMEVVGSAERGLRARFLAFARGHLNYASSPDPAVRAQGELYSTELASKAQVLYTIAMEREQAELELQAGLPTFHTQRDGFLPGQKVGPARMGISLIVALALILAYGACLRYLPPMLARLPHVPEA